MTLNLEPTPGGRVDFSIKVDPTKSIHQQLTETQHTLDTLKTLIENLQQQLDCLKKCQSE